MRMKVILDIVFSKGRLRRPLKVKVTYYALRDTCGKCFERRYVSMILVTSSPFRLAFVRGQVKVT